MSEQLSGSCLKQSGPTLVRDSDFLDAPGDLEENERTFLRNLALRIRVWPGRRQLNFLCLGSGGCVEIALRCGCPEAAIISVSRKRIYGCDLPYTGVSLASGTFVRDIIHNRPQLIVGPENSGELVHVSDIDALKEQVQPGGFVVLISHRDTPTSAMQCMQDAEDYTLQEVVGRLHVFRREGGPEEATPILTVITRTWKRPKQLSANIASLKMQIDPSYQHLVLPDDVGMGLHAANRRLGEVKEQVLGDYVMILDDDDILISPGLVGEARHIKTFKGYPDVVVSRVWRITEIVPRPEAWKLEEYDDGNGHRVCNCYLVAHSLFMETIDAFGAPLAGDQRWQEAFFLRSPTFFWYDNVMSANTRIGRCEPEEDTTIWSQN